MVWYKRENIIIVYKSYHVSVYFIFFKTAMRKKESSDDKSKLRIYGRQSANHRLRQARHTCCTKMLATGKVINR